MIASLMILPKRNHSKYESAPKHDLQFKYAIDEWKSEMGENSQLHLFFVAFQINGG